MSSSTICACGRRAAWTSTSFMPLASLTLATEEETLAGTRGLSRKLASRTPTPKLVGVRVRVRVRVGGRVRVRDRVRVRVRVT